MSTASSRAKVFSGVGWLSGVRVLEKGFGFIRLLVLARILGPAEFGLFGAALLIVSLVEIATDAGLGEYLIRKPSFKSVDLGVGFVWNAARLAVSLGLLLGVFLLSQVEVLPLATTGWYWWWIGLVLVFKLVSNPGLVVFRRQQQFQTLAKIRSISALVDLVVSILATIWLQNGLGLALGMLVGLVVEWFLGWWQAPRGFQLPSRAQLFAPFRFVRWVYASNMISYVLHQGDDWLVSWMFGPSWLGIYQAGYKYSLLPSSQVASSVSQVTYPMLRTKPKSQKLALVVNMTWMSLYPSLLLAALVSIFAYQIILITLGEAWLAVAPLLPVFMFYGVVKTMGSLLTLWFLDANRPQVATQLNLIRLASFALLCVVLIPTLGVLGIAWAVTISTTLATIALGVLLWPHKPHWFRLMQPWILVGLAGLATWLCMPLLPASPLLTVVLGSGFLCVVSAALVVMFDAYARDLIIQEVMPRLPRKLNRFITKTLYWMRYRKWLKPEFRDQALKASDLVWQHTYDLQWNHDCHESLTNDDVRWILKELSTHNISSVLEVGPGTGHLAALVGSNVSSVVVADISQQALKLCAKVGVVGIQSRGERLGLSSKAGDVLIATHVLEHVSNLEETIREWRRVARRGMLIIVPLEEKPDLSANYHLQYFPTLESLHPWFGSETSYELCVNPNDHKPYARISWWWS